jgi:hypothetical protein
MTDYQSELRDQIAQILHDRTCQHPIAECPMAAPYRTDAEALIEQLHLTVREHVMFPGDIELHIYGKLGEESE